LLRLLLLLLLLMHLLLLLLLLLHCEQLVVLMVLQGCLMMHHVLLLHRVQLTRFDRHQYRHELQAGLLIQHKRRQKHLLLLLLLLPHVGWPLCSLLLLSRLLQGLLRRLPHHPHLLCCL
jgi:hypothetical protein